MTPSTFWYVSVLFMVVLYFFLPSLRPVISLLFLPYLGVFVWGILDLKSQFFINALIKNNAKKKQICITFDDGPDPALTPEVLLLLRKYGLKATFFVVAKNAHNTPSLVKEAFLQGHCIACHDLTHSYASNFRMSRTMGNDIGKAQTIIAEIIGKKPLLYRPPMGHANPHMSIALLRLNMICVGWSKRVGDAGNRRLATFKNIPGLAQGRQIVLLHDCLPKPEYKVEFLVRLEQLFTNIKEKKLEAVTIGEMFDCAEYEQDEKVDTVLQEDKV